MVNLAFQGLPTSWIYMQGLEDSFIFPSKLEKGTYCSSSGEGNFWKNNTPLEHTPGNPRGQL